MPAMYRTALRIRREHPALGRRGGDSLEWLESPPGVLAFRRPPGLVCAVNFSTAPVQIPWRDADALCASGPFDGLLLPDTAVWLAPRWPAAS